MEERDLKHWVIDYVEGRLKDKFNPVEKWIDETATKLNSEAEEYRRFTKNLGIHLKAKEKRIARFEGELKAALMLVHEMKGRLDAVLALGELPVVQRRRGKMRERR